MKKLIGMISVIALFVALWLPNVASAATNYTEEVNAMYTQLERYGNVKETHPYYFYRQLLNVNSGQIVEHFICSKTPLYHYDGYGSSEYPLGYAIGPEGLTKNGYNVICPTGSTYLVYRIGGGNYVTNPNMAMQEFPIALSDNVVYECNENITDTITNQTVFRKPLPTLVETVEGTEMTPLRQIISLIPLAIFLVASFLGLRKALEFLRTMLHKA